MKGSHKFAEFFIDLMSLPNIELSGIHRHLTLIQNMNLYNFKTFNHLLGREVTIGDVSTAIHISRCKNL